MMILIDFPHKLPEIKALTTAAANGKLLMAAKPAIKAAAVDVALPGIVYVFLFSTLLLALEKLVIEFLYSSI